MLCVFTAQRKIILYFHAGIDDIVFTMKDNNATFAKNNPLTRAQWQDAITLASIPSANLTNSEKGRIAFYSDVYGVFLNARNVGATDEAIAERKEVLALNS